MVKREARFAGDASERRTERRRASALPARYAPRGTGFWAISSLGCARDPELVEGVMNCHESCLVTVQ